MMDNSNTIGVLTTPSTPKVELLQLKPDSKNDMVLPTLDNKKEQSDSKSDEIEDDTKGGRKITRPPKKWIYQDEPASSRIETVSSKDVPDECVSTIHSVGDLIWCRQTSGCFYTALVTNDPHFKFYTKIVQADAGRPQTSSSDSTSKSRQYHVQFLGDNKLQWVTEKHCMPYQGISHYEQLAVNDTANFKMYKPKSEKMHAWKEAIMVADELSSLEPAERLKTTENARLMKKDAKAFIKKIEADRKNDSVTNSPTKSKLNLSSPKKTPEKERDLSKDAKKSSQYRRQDEMHYKMSKMAGRHADGIKIKSRHEPESPTKVQTALPVFNTNASFSKSFKIKKDKKIETLSKEEDHVPESAAVIVDKAEVDKVDHVQSIEKKDEGKERVDGVEEKLNEEKEKVDEEEKKGDVMSAAIESMDQSEEKEVTNIITSETNKRKEDLSSMNDALEEGSLVWAKMRGYPYWPSIVTRDPMDGKFIKVADTIYKNSRRVHVLFLEYGNQRAWIGSSSIKKYNGIQSFNTEKAKSSKKTRPDFTPNKRVKSQFDKSVKYAEELFLLTDEERLENVLLRYGWALVADNDSLAVDAMDERSGLSDGELDSPIKTAQESETVTETKRRTSVGRVGSSEAETRIDPGTDEPVTDRPISGADGVANDGVGLSITGKRSVEHQSTNGAVDTSDQSLDATSPARKKIKPSIPSSPGSAVKKAAHKTASTRPSDTPSKAVTACDALPKIVNTPGMTLSGTLEKEEFPRVGDLVWGRMPGFPFWPAFVTRSPQNIYRKELTNGKVSHHVQFFGWNDESGWVSTALEFDGLEAFKMIAAKRKSDKSYNLGRGANLKKWEKAAREAEDTMGLTRQERVDQYLVSYAHKLAPASNPPMPTPPLQTPAKHPKGMSSTAAKSIPPSRTPTHSKPPRAVASAGSGKKAALPRGWISETTVVNGKDTIVYISPDGEKFPSKAAMQRHISNGKKSLSVVYITDETLPEGWRCQKVESSIFFFSPIGERFDSRRKVADRMKSDNYSEEDIKKVLSVDKSRRPAPKSVLKRRGEYFTDESSQESEDDYEETTKTLPKGLKYRFGGAYDKYLDISRIFDISNGGIIDMVQLPDIFLEHPTVRVQESDNEMIISDVDSGEFIAKKIIYD